MQRLEVSGAVRLIYGSLGVKRLIKAKRRMTSVSLRAAYRTQIFSCGQWRTQEYCSEGVQQIQFRTEDRENGDLGAVAP